MRMWWRRVQLQMALLVVVLSRFQALEAGPAVRISVLMQCSLDDWCRADPRDSAGRSPQQQFVEGISAGIGAHRGEVRVQRVCSNDGSVCIVPDIACAESGAHGLTRIGTADAALPECTSDLPLDDCYDGVMPLLSHHPNAPPPLGRSRIGNEEGEATLRDLRRIQVMLELPQPFVDVFTSFVLAKTRSIARLGLMVVEMAPRNANASVCEWSQAAQGNQFAGLGGQGRKGEMASDGSSNQGHIAECAAGFRCSLRPEMQLGAPLCKAEVGYYSAARRKMIVLPLWALIAVTFSFVSLYIVGTHFWRVWTFLGEKFWPEEKREVRPYYGLVSWEEYVEHYNKEASEAEDAKVAMAQEEEVEILRPRNSVDYSRQDTDNVDMLLRQLDFALDRFKPLDGSGTGTPYEGTSTACASPADVGRGSQEFSRVSTTSETSGHTARAHQHSSKSSATRAVREMRLRVVRAAHTAVREGGPQAGSGQGVFYKQTVQGHQQSDEQVDAFARVDSQTSSTNVNFSAHRLPLMVRRNGEDAGEAGYSHVSPDAPHHTRKEDEGEGEGEGEGGLS